MIKLMLSVHGGERRGDWLASWAGNALQSVRCNDIMKGVEGREVNLGTDKM